ncbi:MAG TPA: winged helix-turn-helix domain-containing protein, partial [Ilumatobacteraceae bacterium]|nr:winged helix-turn-helix domain-containing protein [Ilumatobacteraceae bacterium]
MNIRLLGTLELVDGDGNQIDIGGTQPRIILAMLVAARGKLVATDALIDTVWDEEPPHSAAGTLQTYVSRLRRALARVGGSIIHETGGYRLTVDWNTIDVHRFEVLGDRARAALDGGDASAARELLIEAERLCRGPALVDVRDRARLAGYARRFDDRRLAALEDRI